MPDARRPARARVPSPSVLALLALPVLVSSAGCDRSPDVQAAGGAVMGTVAELKVVAAGRARADAELRRAFDELERVAAITTAYSDTSDVGRLNAAAGGGIRLAPETDAILLESIRVAEASGGAFDPTAGALVTLWGFDGEPRRPDDAEIARAVAATDWRALRRAEAGPGSAPEWTLERAGARIDLGGIAKGWAVDRAAAILAETGACLVNVGGDLAVRGTKPDGRGWLIGVQDPRDPSRLFLKLRLAGEVAVATSGDYQRWFEEDGVRYHHLLDPRTGRPARALRSVTVVAPSCALADAWATAAFVLGPEEGLARLEGDPRLEGVLVAEDGDGGLLLAETSGFARYREP